MCGKKRKLFRNSFIEWFTTHTANDKKYMNIARTTTTRRFVPSGSSMNKNSVLEQIRDVIPSNACDVVFECMRMSLVRAVTFIRYSKSLATSDLQSFYYT